MALEQRYFAHNEFSGLYKSGETNSLFDFPCDFLLTYVQDQIHFDLNRKNSWTSDDIYLSGVSVHQRQEFQQKS